MRSRLLLLPLILIILLLVAAYRLVGFIHLFFEHAGTSITQAEIRDAYFQGGNGGIGNSTDGVDGSGRKQSIPKIIHQVFHNWKEPGNETMPSDWDEVRRGCREKNGDWEYRLWTEKASRDFIEENYPWFLQTYDSYSFPVQRVDTVRYFLLRHYGGIYLDLDNGCLANLDPLLYYPAWTTDGGRGALSNNILASSPNHPFWVFLTDSLIPYNCNYFFPYVTISYASGQWFETAIWERYHAQKAGIMKEEDRIWRIMMDDREGAAEWVFFTQERGGTWVNWDNALFLWVGDHVVLLGLGVVGLLAATWWGVRKCWVGGGKSARYKKLERDVENF